MALLALIVVEGLIVDGFFCFTALNGDYYRIKVK